jgi:single-strand DNA-binding protein
MSSDNFVQIVGTLGGDPTLRFTTGGIAVCSFSVAWSPRKKTDTGWEDGDTSWFRCTVWREMAENVASSLAKGMRVVVTGQVHIREWEDQEGNKRTSTEIQVDEVSPSLRWATSTVEKVVRDKPVNENRGEAGGGTSGHGYDYDDSDEPF